MKIIVKGGIEKIYDFKTEMFDSQGILFHNLHYVLFVDFLTYLSCAKFIKGNYDFKANSFLTFASYFSYILRDVYIDIYGQYKCIKKANFISMCSNTNDFLGYLSTLGIGQSFDADFQNSSEFYYQDYNKCLNSLDTRVFKVMTGFIGGSIKDFIFQQKLGLSAINHSLYELALNQMNSFHISFLFSLSIEYITNVLQEDSNKIVVKELIGGTLLYTILAYSHSYLFENVELNDQYFSSFL